MRKFLDSLYLASGWIAAFFIGAICALVVAQVCLNLIDRISGLLTGTAIGLTIPSYADFTGFFLAAASFSIMAILRLVRFNLESEKEQESHAAHAYFRGLPSPAAAGAA